MKLNFDDIFVPESDGRFTVRHRVQAGSFTAMPGIGFAAHALLLGVRVDALVGGQIEAAVTESALVISSIYPQGR